MKGLQEILEKLLRKKKTEEIPIDYVKCIRCGNIIKKEKAVISLPEEEWVCEKCYFGYAE